MSKIKQVTIYEYGNKTYRTARGLRERIANDIVFRIMRKVQKDNYKKLFERAERRLRKIIHE